MLATDILHLPAGFYLLQYPDDLGLSESTFLRYCGQPFGSFADLLAELRASLPDYSKGDACIFDKVGGGEGLRRALHNAAQPRQALAAEGAKRPVTYMDKLVEALREIAPRRSALAIAVVMRLHAG